MSDTGNLAQARQITEQVAEATIIKFVQDNLRKAGAWNTL